MGNHRGSLKQASPALAALLFCAGARVCGAEAADEDPIRVEDRGRAECIEEYNDMALSKPDRDFRFNPFSIQLSGNLLGGTSSGARAVAEGWSWGGTVDVDAPVVAIPGQSAKRLVLGLAAGLSGMATYRSGNNWQWSIELRLGAARRRVDMVNYPDCRRHRTDLVVYFLRWRAGNFIDLTEPGYPDTFNSTVSPLTVVVRNRYQTGGTSLGGSLDFRMVRSLQPGLLVTGEQYVGRFFLRLTLAGYVPHPTGFVSVGIGYTFEFLGSP